jgi:tRNA (guanine37-N1)-methyltransferase
MKIDILTLFPEMFRGPFDESIIKRAQKEKLVEIQIHDLRNWAKDKRKTVDDRPFGGGAGMILRLDVIDDAIWCLAGQAAVDLSNDRKLIWSKKKHRLILMSPSGKRFDQKKASELAKLDYLLLLCGHYEGIDHRVSERLVDEEISIGDYVLTGGELPAMVVVDSIVRLLPGVLKKSEATSKESFSVLKIKNSKIKNLLEYPQYTRPEEYKGWKVPKVLLSGNHKKIAEWRVRKAIELTKKKRPDLL